jgi:hypothetical protein
MVWFYVRLGEVYIYIGDHNKQKLSTREISAFVAFLSFDFF